ncbi:hypothetical protein RD792_011905 [Penstemon davidsonii]|uniref:THO1-MOS11 C-terminal domain-containing protein n=1 Tax=Penstemon davidsonii TaxID=160366 RepID=A0ABR0CVD9_9LAMI|nr:hypothetical protein RD792_011905 [Penstemon davidsonii]
MATATAPKVDNPKVPSDPNFVPPTTEDASSTQPPSSSDGKGDESKSEPAAEVAAKKIDVDDSAAVTAIQKKMKRAERFGTTVQLSEEEKRNSRAERFSILVLLYGVLVFVFLWFGTVPAVSGVDSSKKSEELKKKSRAERFGIAQSAPADEEVKKKARLARFGFTPKSDSVEEDKKKARALRFSQPDSGSKKNGTENNEEKTAIADKAGGGT